MTCLCWPFRKKLQGSSKKLMLVTGCQIKIIQIWCCQNPAWRFCLNWTKLLYKNQFVCARQKHFLVNRVTYAYRYLIRNGNKLQNETADGERDSGTVASMAEVHQVTPGYSTGSRTRQQVSRTRRCRLSRYRLLYVCWIDIFMPRSATCCPQQSPAFR